MSANGGETDIAAPPPVMSSAPSQPYSFTEGENSVTFASARTAMVRERLSWPCIEAFYAGATSESLAAAADQLGLSRAAISISIKKLERRLGQRLFQGLGGRRHLTPTGEELLATIQPVIDEWRLMERRLSEDKASSGSLPPAVPRSEARSKTGSSRFRRKLA
jgi:DNA-binding MarR family transcriptional regulator